MAFYSAVQTNASYHCDKCKKAASQERPVLNLGITSRSSIERQFICIHLACLKRILAKESARREAA